jgi:tetratricopeptide (TPR) repeat protein
MAELAAEPLLLRPEQAAHNYEEAVAAAVEKCAEDTAGQRCYICYGEGDEDEGLVRGCSCRGGAGFAHVSCLARQAQVAVERDAQIGWPRWTTCRQCEQKYHGVVACALGWACWKTYVDRPDLEDMRCLAMGLLAGGLRAVGDYEDALSVMEVELPLMRRLDAPEKHILGVQTNLATLHEHLGRRERALEIQRDVYSGVLDLSGEEHKDTLQAALNYAASLVNLGRLEEAKEYLREKVPVARRVLGDSNGTTLRMRWGYARTLYRDPGATLDDLREAVTTLEETGRIARRVLGGAHPNVGAGDVLLREARAALSAHLVVQGNLAGSYGMLGRNEQALNMFRDVYSGFLRLNGEEDADTLRAALGYASSLINLQRFEEAKEYLREKVPVARSALGENNEITIRMRWTYATALYKAAAATLDDLREAVATLEETERVARREYGGAHPHTRAIEFKLQESRAALRAREDAEPVSEQDLAELMRLHMKVLEHASACRDANCPSANCRKVKGQLSHTATCTTGVQGGCATCSCIWALLTEHARQCTKPAGSCPVSCCAQYKAQLAQMQQQGAEGETTTAS